jgi:RNA polymerase sigma-70 factor, ECF subfamily
MAGSEMTFVMTVARRRLLDALRAKRRRPGTFELQESDSVGNDASQGDWELAEEAARARAALAQLRPEERQVLEMLLLSGLSQTEVAETTGLPLGTVKTHARRGLIKVRQIMGVNGGRA